MDIDLKNFLISECNIPVHVDHGPDIMALVEKISP